MNIKNTCSLTEARKNIFSLADQVQKTGIHLTFTEKGSPKVVLMSADEFEAWQETIEILHNPQLMKTIKRAERNISKKDYLTLEEVLKTEGFVLQDKKNKYVSGNPKKRRRKTSQKA